MFVVPYELFINIEQVMLDKLQNNKPAAFLSTLKTLKTEGFLLNNSVELSEKQRTNYEKIDFTDIEFFEENILANLEEYLFEGVGKIDFTKCEMSYKQVAFLNGVIRKTTPKTIVEIGLSAGGSSCVILNAIRDIENAKLYSFDYNTIWYREEGKNNARKTGFLVEQIVPELIGKWELHTGGVPCKYFNKYLPNEGVDVCFIDTAHRNPGEHLNILEILPFMKKNGIIILHDTAFHISSPIYTTNINLINSLKGKRIFLKTEKTMGLPNISAVVLDENIDDMLYCLFSNLSLPWDYKITKDDFVEMFKHFSKYYSKDLLQFYIYYCCFYMSNGFRNQKTAVKIAEEMTTRLFKNECEK